MLTTETIEFIKRELQASYVGICPSITLGNWADVVIVRGAPHAPQRYRVPLSFSSGKWDGYRIAKAVVDKARSGFTHLAQADST